MKSFDTTSQQKPIIDQNVINDMFGLTSPSTNDEATPEQQTEQEQPATTEQTTPETATATPAPSAETAPSDPSDPSDPPVAPSTATASDPSDLSDPSDNPATTVTPPTGPPQDDDIDILYDQLEYLGYTDLGDKKDFHSVMADQNNVVKAYNILKQEQEQGNYEGLCTLNEFKQYMSNAQKAYDQRRVKQAVQQQKQAAADRIQQQAPAPQRSLDQLTADSIHNTHASLINGMRQQDGQPAQQTLPDGTRISKAQAQELTKLQDGGQLGQGMQNLTKELYNSLSPEDQNYIRQQGVDINALPSSTEVQAASTDVMTAMKSHQGTTADGLYQWMKGRGFDMKGIDAAKFNAIASTQQGRRQLYNTLSESAKQDPSIQLPSFDEFNRMVVQLGDASDNRTPEQRAIDSPLFGILYQNDQYIQVDGQLVPYKEAFARTAAGKWVMTHSQAEQEVMADIFKNAANTIAVETGSKSFKYGSDLGNQQYQQPYIKKLTEFMRDQFARNGEDLTPEQMAEAVAGELDKLGLKTEQNYLRQSDRYLDENYGDKLGTYVDTWSPVWDKQAGEEATRAYEQEYSAFRHDPMSTHIAATNKFNRITDVQNEINFLFAKAGLVPMQGVEVDPSFQKAVQDSISEQMAGIAGMGQTGEAQEEYVVGGLSNEESESLFNSLYNNVIRNTMGRIARQVLEKRNVEGKEFADAMGWFGKFIYNTAGGTVFGNLMKAGMQAGLSDYQKEINQVLDQHVMDSLGEVGVTASTIIAFALDNAFLSAPGKAGAFLSSLPGKKAVQTMVARLVADGMAKETATNLAKRAIAGKFISIITQRTATSAASLSGYNFVSTLAKGAVYGGSYVYDKNGNPVFDEDGMQKRHSVLHDAVESGVHGLIGGAAVGAAGTAVQKFTGNTFAYKAFDDKWQKTGKFLADYGLKVISEATAFSMADVITMCADGNFSWKNYGEALWGGLKFIFAIKASHSLVGFLGAKAHGQKTEFQIGPQKLISREASRPLSKDAMRELQQAGYGSDIYEIAQNLLGGKEIYFNPDDIVQRDRDGNIVRDKDGNPVFTGNPAQGLFIPEQLEQFAAADNISVSTKCELLSLISGTKPQQMIMPPATRTERKTLDDGTTVIETYADDGSLIGRGYYTDAKKADKTFNEVNGITTINAVAVARERNRRYNEAVTEDQAWAQTLEEYGIRDENGRVLDFDRYMQAVQVINNAKESSLGHEPTTQFEKDIVSDFNHNLREARKNAESPESVRRDINTQYGVNLEKTLKTDPREWNDIQWRAVKDYEQRLNQGPDRAETRARRQQEIDNAVTSAVSILNYKPEDVQPKIDEARQKLQEQMPEGVKIPETLEELEQFEQLGFPKLIEPAMEYLKAKAMLEPVQQKLEQQFTADVFNIYNNGYKTASTPEALAELQLQINDTFQQASQTFGRDYALRFWQMDNEAKLEEIRKQTDPARRDLLMNLSKLAYHKMSVMYHQAGELRQTAVRLFHETSQAMDTPFVYDKELPAAEGEVPQTQQTVRTGSYQGRAVIVAQKAEGSDIVNVYDIESKEVIPVKEADIENLSEDKLETVERYIMEHEAEAAQAEQQAAQLNAQAQEILRLEDIYAGTKYKRGDSFQVYDDNRQPLYAEGVVRDPATGKVIYDQDGQPETAMQPVKATYEGFTADGLIRVRTDIPVDGKTFFYLTPDEVNRMDGTAMQKSETEHYQRQYANAEAEAAAEDQAAQQADAKQKQTELARQQMQQLEQQRMQERQQLGQQADQLEAQNKQEQQEIEDQILRQQAQDFDQAQADQQNAEDGKTTLQRGNPITTYQRNEDGSVNFMKLSPERIYDYLMEDVYEGMDDDITEYQKHQDAAEFVSKQIQSLQAKKEKLEGKRPKVDPAAADPQAKYREWRKQLGQLDQQTAHWNQVRDMIARSRQANYEHEANTARNTKKIQQVEPQDFRQFVMRALYLGKGMLRWNSTGQGMGKQRGVMDETGYGQGEKKALSWLFNDKEGMPLETFAKRMSQEWREYASADNLIPVDGYARFPDDMEARNEIIDILSSFSSRDDLARQILDDAQRNDPEYQQQEYERQQKEDYDQQARDLGYKDYDDMIRQQQQAESRQWFESQETGRLDYQQTPYFAEGWQGTPDRIQQTGVTPAQHQAIFEQGAKAFQTATERAVSEHRAVTLQDFEQAYRERSGQFFDTDRPYLQRYFNHFRDQANRDYKRRLQADQARARGQEPAEHPERIAAEQRRAEAAEAERLQAEQAAQEAQRQAQATTEIPEPDGKTPSLDQARELDNAQRTAANLGLPVIFTDSDNPIHKQGAADNSAEATRRGSNAYVFFPKGGGEPRIVINVDRCKDWNDVYLKTLHEGSAHYGLRQMFGKDYDTFLDNVYDAATDELRAGIDQFLNYNPQYKRDINGQPIKNEEGRDIRDNLADRRQAVDEYLAHLAEKRPQDLTQPERTLWAKIKEWFISLLRQKGFNIKQLTDEDLIDLLRESHRRLLQQEAARRQADPSSPADRTQVLRTSEPGAPEPPTEAPSSPDGGTDRLSKAEDYTFSEFRAERGGRFYQNKSGEIDLVDISDDVFNKMGIPKMPFRITDGMAYHVFTRHQKELGLENEADAVRYVVDLMHSFDHVRKGDEENTFIFSIENGRDKNTHRSITLVIPDSKNKYLGIKTAGLVRLSNIEKRPVLWEKSEPSTTGAAPANVTTTQPNEDGRTGGNASNQSTDLSSKDTQISPTDQTNSQKSATEQGKNSYSLSSFNPIEQVRTNIERRKIERAEQETDTEPTDAQKEAGNYKKGHIRIDGYDLTIEQPKGSVRRGTDASGKQWEQVMRNTYGYIRGTEGVDGDHIDVFLSDDPSHGDVFVVDQVNKDGSFDEHKVMYGFPDVESARKAYLSNYEDGWTGLGAITPVSKEQFKNWIRSSHRKTKPFAEYSSVKTLSVKEEQGTTRYSLPLQPANDPALTPEQNRLLSPESLIKLLDNGESAEHYCDEALGTPYRHVAWGDRLTSYGRFNERRRKEGLHIDFDIQGNLVSYGLYHDGRREGMHYTFNPQGDRLIEGAFSNGTRVGTHRVFYDTYSQAPRYDLPGLKPEKREQVRDEITYNQQGQPDGEAYSYSSSGKLLERHIFKNGKLLAEWYAPAYLKSILKSVVSGDEIRISNMTPHQAWWQLRAYRRNGSAPWIPQGQPGEGQPYKPSETDTADEADKPLHQWNPVQAVKENTQRRQARQLTIDFHEAAPSNLSDPSDLSDLSDPSDNPAATRKGRQMPPSMLTDEELLLRTRTEEGSTDDWNLYNDEYDRRHRQEYADLTDHYRDVIEKTSPTLDDAYDMLATADQHFHYGGYASTERTELLAQRDVLQDYIDRKEAEQAEAQQGTDHYSLPEDQQRTDDIIKAAEKHFGTTRDIREAGYILPDGKLLDFSGRHDLEPGTSDRPVRGQRTSDHRDIRQIAFDKDDNPTGITTDMADFIRRGAIRIDANYGAVNLAVKPTEQQRRRIRELVAHNEGDIYIDFGDGDNTDHYAEYEGAKPTRILADIDRYFDEGIKPEGVTFYSLPMETPENVKKEMFDIRKQAKSTKTWLKTPNNKSSNLDERQWTQVRTTPFKEWFGDWQSNEARQYILEGEPASSIENKKIMAKPGQTFRQAVAELFQTQGGKADSAFGEVLLDPTGVSNDIQHGMGPIKNATFASVKDVLEKGRVILPMGYYETSGKKQMTGFIAAPINIDGERYVCVVGVIRNKKDNKLYIHEAFSMKKLQLDAASNVVHDGEAVSPHPAGAVAKLVKNILTAKNSSKIVDENGEPLVVYHQTNSTVYINKETGQNWDELDWREKDEWEERDDWDEYWQEQNFYTFDNKNHGRRSIEYPAFFFSPKNDPYHEYGKRTIAVYLNIKNPAISPDIENRGVTDTAGEDAMKKLIEQGYDGVIRTDENGKPYEYIAFFPEQIKSATDNIGTFIPSNGDIRFSLPGGNTNNTPSTGVSRGIDLSSWDPLASVRQHVTDSRQARLDADQAWTDHRARREQAIASHTAVKNDPNLTPAQKNRLQNDMIRRVADVRALVSKVREGDRESVKAVTQTVLDLADAVGDGLTRGAVKKLMHAVENATTRRDVKTEVDKAVDAILTQVTREAQRQTEKLLHTKATKLDPNNIRVAGQMDEHGQRSLRQLNELLSPEGQSTDLDQLEAQLQSDTQSSRQVTAGNARDKLVGLNLAKLHRDTVAQTAQEIHEMRQEVKQLEEEIYDIQRDDQGKVISKRIKPEYTGSNVTPADKARRESIEQQIDAIQDAIQDSRVQLIQQTAHFNNELSAVVEGGKNARRAWAEQQRQHQDDIMHDANRDLQGVSSNPYERQAKQQSRKDRGKKPTTFKERVGQRFSKWLGAPFQTFDTFLRKFGYKSPQGEGYLYNRFSRQWTDSATRQWLETKKDNATMDAKVQELFGEEFGAKHYKDIYTVCAKMDAERRKQGREIQLTYTRADASEPVTLTIGTGQALYIILADQQVDGRMKLRKQGITEADVDRLKAELDPRILQMGDWIVNEFLPDKREWYNETYKRIYGADMAENANYFPLQVFDKARSQKAEVGDKTKGNTLNTKPGSIVERKRNTTPLDPTADAFDVLSDHVTKMNDWASWQEMRNDLSSLNSNTAFRNKVENMPASWSLGYGEQLFDNFQKACELATGSYDPQRGAGSDFMTAMAKNVTAAKINFRIHTAIKQLLSHPAFWSDAAPTDLIKAFVNFNGTWKWAMENLPVLQKRWQSRTIGDTRLEDDSSTMLSWLSSVNKGLSKYGMLANAGIDAYTCASGARAVYDTRMRYYTKQLELSNDEAHKLAVRDATVAFNQSQQSSEGMFVSPIQKDRDFGSVMFTTFRNGPMGYGRQLRNTISDLKVLVSSSRQELIDHRAKQLQNDYGLSEDRAQEQAEKDYNRRIRKDLARLAIYGYVVGAAWNMGANLMYYLLGDDDDKKAQDLRDDLYHGVATPIEGLAGGNWLSDLFNNVVVKKDKFSFTSFFEIPFQQDIERILEGLDKKDPVPAYTNVVNLLAQGMTGTNLSTLTDVYAAVADAAEGYKGAESAEDIAEETTLAMLRIIQTPSGSSENYYLDRLKDSDGNIDPERVNQFCRRYVEFKKMKDSDGFLYEIFDNAMSDADNRYAKRYNNLISSRPSYFKRYVEEQAVREQVTKRTQMEETEDNNRQKAESGKKIFQKHAPMPVINAYLDMREQMKQIGKQLEDRPNGQTDRKGYKQWNLDHHDIAEKAKALKEASKQINAIFRDMSDSTLADDIQRISVILNVPLEE